jgi:phospholipid-binding lipoprotein MlaA
MPAAGPVTDEADSPTTPAATTSNVGWAQQIYDPWEPFNRRVYTFNAKFDESVFLPAVNAYEAIVPIYLQDRFTAFFANIDDIRNFLNSVLQLKPGVAAKTTARFAFNSTFGILGLWDVATAMEIPRQEEDFGQTLGHWGVTPGPYLVLPILGPSSVRDGFGSGVDLVSYFYIHPLNFVDHAAASAAYTVLYAIDLRHQYDFRYYQTGSPFEYQLVRRLYMQQRELEVAR